MDNACRKPLMLTIKETAIEWNLPEHYVRQKVLSGEFFAVKAGRKYLVNQELVRAYLFGEKAAQTAENKDSRAVADDTLRMSPISLK